MTPDLRVYGNLDEFSLNDAAYLFLNFQPRSEYEVEPPKVVADMQKVLNRALSLLKNSEGLKLQAVDPRTAEFYFSSASRNALAQVASNLGLTPKFLFPEMVEEPTKKAVSEIQDKPLPTKKRNSYLKLIKGLLKKQGIDPSERGNAKGLEGMVAEAGHTLGQDAIRDILKEIKELETD